MLTVSHIITLLTIGVLVSGGLALCTEWIANGMEGEKTPREKWVRRWLPVFGGLFFGSWGFPATVSVVVGPVLPFSVWWVGLLWLAGGLFAGLCAGAGAWMAYELAGLVLRRKVDGD